MKDEQNVTVQVVNRHLDGLIPYARNARTHTKAQVAAIAASLCEYGWTAPVLLDGQSGILAGHGRVAAVRLIVETGRLIPHWPDPALVPTIDLGHLTPAQRRAYVLTDNRLAEMAGWDSELLALELADLQQEGFNLDLTGFSALEIADLTSMLAPTPLLDGVHSPLSDIGEIPEAGTMIVIGMYRAPISRAAYLAWQDQLRRDVGLEKPLILAEIKRRLRVPDESGEAA